MGEKSKGSAKIRKISSKLVFDKAVINPLYHGLI